MELDRILVPERTFANLETTSKKRAIEKIANLLGESTMQFSSDIIYRELIAREKLGPTALGHGVALPHCRLEQCTDTLCAVFQLSDAVDFGALDDEPVNIIFVVLFPKSSETDHLHTLAEIARRCESEEYRNRLIAASDDKELYDMVLLEPDQQVDSRSAL
jgi:nitrogen PTS system EIIA component